MNQINQQIGAQMHAQSQGEVRWAGPKKWADCSADEKIERLRQEIDSWRTLCSNMHAELELLKNHAHGADGRPVVWLETATHQRYLNQAQSYNNLA